jgi:hypothetical protein
VIRAEKSIYFSEDIKYISTGLKDENGNRVKTW